MCGCAGLLKAQSILNAQSSVATKIQNTGLKHAVTPALINRSNIKAAIKTGGS